MKGVVVNSGSNRIKINLQGRLGVIEIDPKLIAGTPETGEELKFYFSYLQVEAYKLDYDISPLKQEQDLSPCLIGAVIKEVNDTAVKAEIIGGIGTVAVPLRWVFTAVPLQCGQWLSFYLSRLRPSV